MMKNPLNRRFPRELRQDFGKYLAIFLFLLATIGFVSGFLVADGSMKRAYDDSFTTYNVEDGHFTLSAEAGESLLASLRAQNVNLYRLDSVDRDTSAGHTVRFYANRTQINRASVLSGVLPQADNDIAIDRLYAKNNHLSVGDSMTVSGKTYRICGLVALSDYTALFRNNTDMMFDAQKFTVALVTAQAFDDLGDTGRTIRYAWKNRDQNLSAQARSDLSERLLNLLEKQPALTGFVKQADNQAITFAGDDMGSDKVMITVMLYIEMVALAFVFAVTAGHTIERESTVIGTLRASGYTRGELLAHYLTMPVLVSLAAAVAGNVLGYTVFKRLIASMYYGSYSLPAYRTIWNADAFLLTTVVPCLIMLVVNLAVLLHKLSFAPLQFLRRDFGRGGGQKAVRLPQFRFLTRFRLRVVLQNRATYAMMFVGILLANTMLLFGLMFQPLLERYKSEVLDSRIANYQYILKTQTATGVSGAEKYAVASLATNDARQEEITVYGIASNSSYLPKLQLSKTGGAVVSKGYLEKYGVQIGDSITLREKFSDKRYTFRITGSYNYPAALAVFLTDVRFDAVFGKSSGYFNGYFSNQKLTDIDSKWIASTITEHDLTLVADQLQNSMGSIFPMFGGFAALIYLLMIYLLSKLIIEKNAAAISMVKILGYTDREAARLYLSATTAVVAASLAISLPIAAWIIRRIYYAAMTSINGWLTFYIDPALYAWTFVIGCALYGAVTLLQMRKIRRVPMNEALKGME